MIKKKQVFKRRNKILVKLRLQFLDITELGQFEIPITARH